VRQHGSKDRNSSLKPVWLLPTGFVLSSQRPLSFIVVGLTARQLCRGLWAMQLRCGLVPMPHCSSYIQRLSTLLRASSADFKCYSGVI